MCSLRPLARRAFDKLFSSRKKRDKIRFDLAALDSYSTVTAEDVVFLPLLDDLVQGLKNGMGAKEKVELQGTYMYTFIGVIMPRVVRLGVCATPAVSYGSQECSTGW